MQSDVRMQYSQTAEEDIIFHFWRRTWMTLTRRSELVRSMLKVCPQVCTLRVPVTKFHITEDEYFEEFTSRRSNNQRSIIRCDINCENVSDGVKKPRSEKSGPEEGGRGGEGEENKLVAFSSAWGSRLYSLLAPKPMSCLERAAVHLANLPSGRRYASWDQYYTTNKIQWILVYFQERFL